MIRLLDRLLVWLAGPRPRSLPWKRVASRLRLQRDQLLRSNAAQKLLLVWILNQLALERLAGRELVEIERIERVMAKAPIDPRRGQA